MEKFRAMLESLDYQALMQLKQDLDNQGLRTKTILDEKLKAKQQEHEKTCATCSAELRSYTKSNYTLVFGPDDFRKKASFCGLDCLDYFTRKLREMNIKPHRKIESA